MAKSDRQTAEMIKQLIDRHVIDGDEDTPVNAAPTDRDNSNRQDDITEGIDRKPSVPETDQEYEEMYGSEDEDDEGNPPMQPDRMQGKYEDADPRMNQAKDEEMVPVPKRMVNTIMQAMMDQASSRSIARSRGADGSSMSEPMDDDDSGKPSVNAVAPLDEQYRDPRRKQINRAMNQRDG